MPHRSAPPDASQRFRVPADPMARFIEIYAALEADRGFWEDPTALRFAAISMLTNRAPATAVAEGIRATAEELRHRVGWFSELRSPLRFILSAMLLQAEDTPAAFLAEVDRVEKLFRAARLRRGHAFEKVAIFVLRNARDLRPVEPEDIARFKAIYEQMKRYHWWLTGPDDFPACAMLVRRDGTPEEIGEGVERIYQALHEVGFTRGNPLQTAANLLYLTGIEARAVAERMRAIADYLVRIGINIHPSEYDEISLLCFLAQPISRICDLVYEYRETIVSLRPSPGANLSFTLAASVAFVRLVGFDRDMRAISDAKALLDMQAILAAQQSAAVAAAAAAASAGAS
ncbi:MAG: DUF4003 family protein [Myxococcales bacterium]|nr:DUF4003 family protein [Myxococcales bacterium]